MTDYTNQLLDFMYVDRPKVSSLIAQCLSEGLIEDQQESKTKSDTTGGTLGISSGKIFSLIGLSVNGTKSIADTTAETVKKNPEWAQAKALVQYVSDAQDQSSQEPNEVGQLRILHGKLSIYDLTPFRRIADNDRLIESASDILIQIPELLDKDLQRFESEIQRLEESKQASKNKGPINAKIIELKTKKTDVTRKLSIMIKLFAEGVSEIIKSSPFSIIALLETEEGKYWFTLKENSLLHDQGDTILKYGYEIEGDWAVACIVDGERMQNRTMQKFAPNLNDHAFLYKIAENLANTTREYAGRRQGYKSLMPLVVFRNLGTILR